MYYFEARDLGLVFDLVYTHYASKEEVPHYTDEQIGTAEIKDSGII